MRFLPQSIIKVYFAYVEFEQHHSMIDMKASGTYIALEQIQDPANLGSVYVQQKRWSQWCIVLGDCL